MLPVSVILYILYNNRYIEMYIRQLTLTLHFLTLPTPLRGACLKLQKSMRLFHFFSVEEIETVAKIFNLFIKVNLRQISKNEKFIWHSYLKG